MNALAGMTSGPSGPTTGLPIAGGQLYLIGMKSLVAVFLVIVCAPAFGEPVYRWTDDQGVVHFGDEPRPGAERIEVEEPPTIKTQRPRASGEPAEESERGGESSRSRYERLRIVAPAPQATIRGNPGDVTVRLGLEPTLRRGDLIRVRMDGTPVVDGPSRSLTVVLRSVPRGEHTITAAVINEDGKAIAKAEPVTFYMHRPSVNLPSNPQ